MAPIPNSCSPLAGIADAEQRAEIIHHLKTVAPDTHFCVSRHRARRRRHTQDIGVSQTAYMSHLTHEQQVFVLHQLRNWLFGHYPVFNALNAAWAPRGAEAYFWN